MTLTLTTIPEKTVDWPAWLDGQLVDRRLGDLIDELSQIADVAEHDSVQLAAIVTPEQLHGVCQFGTAVLSVQQSCCLFGNPAALLQLQELILKNGSEYWDDLARSHDLQLQSNRIFAGLPLQPSPNRLPADAAEPQTRRGRLPWIVSAVGVALLAVTLWQNQPAGDAHWGLGNPALLSSTAKSADDWFRAVATAGKEWQGRDLSDKDKLLSSIKDVSDACQKLIDNPNSGLTDVERTWFVQKGQNWKGKLDSTSADLQAGKLTLDAARTQASGIMTKLVDVLNTGPSAADLKSLVV